MSSNNKLRFATVGTSHIAELYVKGALDSELWDLTAVYSRKVETGLTFGEKFGCKTVFTNLEELAKSDLIDAVYIASPNAFHYKQCKTFLENGKHVICEKPLCSHKSDAEELFKLAEENNLIFMEALLYMHIPARKIFKQGIKSCGEIRNAFVNFSRKSKQLNRLLSGEVPNIFNPQMEAGGLMDLGIYCIYPIVDTFGEPEDFDINIYKLETGADGVGSILFKYPNKCVTLNYSKICDSFIPSEFQGENATLSVDSVGLLSGIKLTQHDGTSTLLFSEEEKFKLMGYEAKDFYNFIHGEDIDKFSHCRDMSIKVTSLLERLREKADINFPSDK
jgi:scyllo-inositol 2-dehydrogenase (NADP+)